MCTPDLGLSERSSTSGVLPIAWITSPYFPPHGRFSSRGSKASESVVLLLEHHGVGVRVAGRAAAQQAQRLGAGRPQLVAHAWGDHDGVAGADHLLLVAEAHAAGAVREEVDLLGGSVVVLDRLGARLDGRLGQALVDGVAAGLTGELADLGAVEGHERLHLGEVVDAHGAQATAARAGSAPLRCAPRPPRCAWRRRARSRATRRRRWRDRSPRRTRAWPPGSPARSGPRAPPAAARCPSRAASRPGRRTASVPRRRPAQDRGRGWSRTR